jgi:hypothetical protein
MRGYTGLPKKINKWADSSSISLKPVFLLFLLFFN